ncbi:cytochrome P450 monooxygenase 22 [Orobanche gracilis]
MASLGGGGAAVEWHQRPPNPKNPIVFFDITIGNIPAGRIKMELFSDIAPQTAENFSAVLHRGIQ